MTEELNLDAPGVLALLSKEVLTDIDNAAIALHEDGPRTHLGASEIGDECARKLWYKFRWVFHKVHTGRMQRLFQRGHREEAVFIQYLTKAGYECFPLDPATGEQWRMSGVGGHFGGSCDGFVKLPSKYNYSGRLLTEFKTNGTGAGFNDLLRAGCALKKPVHFDQQCIYGYKFDVKYAVYLNVCKNDDNIHAEVHKLDLNRGADLERKAEAIILSQVPPARLSESPAYFSCKFCDFAEICHSGKASAKNCRSCTHASPRDQKVWFCDRHGADIPADFIPKGCGDWKSII